MTSSPTKSTPLLGVAAAPMLRPLAVGLDELTSMLEGDAVHGSAG
ncbi:hypothetical protein P3H15_42265 [Rhodococcus sp. T2V]|jgi:hypothetical protein|nr:hypothetical protein [Rhodococcus sp. T2V]MDF3311607.1 hypothetical protein [Rhodococcus sp. T2V]